MHLLRSLWFFSATLDIHIIAEHIAEADISFANMFQFLFSRLQTLPISMPLP